MALTPEEQQLINKLLQEGIALARQLGDETSKASLENFTGDLNTAERLVHSLRDEWKKYTSDVEGTREGFTNVVSEIKKLTTGSKAASTAFSGLTSLAAKLQRHQENTSKLSSKELKDLQKQVQEKVSDLKLAGKLSKQEVKDLETKKASQGLSSKEQRQLEAARAAHANISQEITENMGFIKQFNDQLDDSVNRTENLEDALGLGGNALKGMQGAMGKLGLGVI
jgi:archaellum component FlaC